MFLLDSFGSLKPRLKAERLDPSVVRSFVSAITTEQYFTVVPLIALVYHSGKGDALLFVATGV